MIIHGLFAAAAGVLSYSFHHAAKHHFRANLTLSSRRKDLFFILLPCGALVDEMGLGRRGRGRGTGARRRRKRREEERKGKGGKRKQGREKRERGEEKWME